ncbi:MAG: outer membrane beta-barrel protein [Paludibacteraceae bacterium]|nr:outer membrane beta-barrel protein [Paludibacteraceae bacterium]
MKKIIMFLFGGLLCSQAFASGYNRLYAGPSVMRLTNFGYDQDVYLGGHLGYQRGINLTKDRIPLFLQVGAEAVYETADYESDVPDDMGQFIDGRYHFMNVSVPVNISYRFGKENFSVEPFLGMNFRGNIIGKMKYEDGSERDFFDSEDANRFQFGLNVGVGFNIYKFYVGYKFTPDLTEYLSELFCDDKSSYHHISLGFNF